MVIANVFPKLQNVKILVRPLSKRRRLRKRYDSQHVKMSQNSCEISVRALLSCFFIILEEFGLQNVSPSVG